MKNKICLSLLITLSSLSSVVHAEDISRERSHDFIMGTVSSSLMPLGYSVYQFSKFPTNDIYFRNRLSYMKYGGTADPQIIQGAFQGIPEGSVVQMTVLHSPEEVKESRIVQLQQMIKETESELRDLKQVAPRSHAAFVQTAESLAKKSQELTHLKQVMAAAPRSAPRSDPNSFEIFYFSDKTSQDAKAFLDQQIKKGRTLGRLDFILPEHTQFKALNRATKKAVGGAAAGVALVGVAVVEGLSHGAISKQFTDSDDSNLTTRGTR